MGPSVLAGVGSMVLLLPLNFISGYISKKFQVKLMQIRDERIKMINEILNGIKVGVACHHWDDGVDVDFFFFSLLCLTKGNQILRLGGSI